MKAGILQHIALLSLAVGREARAVPALLHGALLDKRSLGSPLGEGFPIDCSMSQPREGQPEMTQLQWGRVPFLSFI